MKSTSIKLKPRGMTLLECTVALALLATGLVLTAQVLVTCAQERLEAQRVLAAQLEVANVGERIAAMPLAEVTAGALDALKPSSSLASAIPNAQLHVTSIDSPASEPPHKRVQIEILWPAEDETPHRVGLTTWKFAAAQETQP